MKGIYFRNYIIRYINEKLSKICIIMCVQIIIEQLLIIC